MKKKDKLFLRVINEADSKHTIEFDIESITTIVKNNIEPINIFSREVCKLGENKKEVIVKINNRIVPQMNSYRMIYRIPFMKRLKTFLWARKGPKGIRQTYGFRFLMSKEAIVEVKGEGNKPVKRKKQ